MKLRRPPSYWDTVAAYRRTELWSQSEVWHGAVHSLRDGRIDDAVRYCLELLRRDRLVRRADAFRTPGSADGCTPFDTKEIPARCPAPGEPWAAWAEEAARTLGVHPGTASMPPAGWLPGGPGDGVPDAPDPAPDARQAANRPVPQPGAANASGGSDGGVAALQRRARRLAGGEPGAGRGGGEATDAEGMTHATRDGHTAV